MNELLRLRTAEAALKKSEAERREITRKIEIKVGECDVEFKKLIDAILDDLDHIRHNANHKLKKGLSESMLRRANELDSCRSFAQVQQMLQVINIGLQHDVEQCFFDIGADTKNSVQDLATKYGDRAELVSAPMQETLKAELELDGGILAKIPNAIMTILDYLIPIIILPTPFFIDIFIRHFAAKSDTLKNLLPANIAADLLAGQIKGKLIGQQKEILTMVCGKLDDAFADAKAKTRKSMEQASREEMEAIRAGLDVKGAANAEAETKRVGKVKAELEQALRGLNVN